MESFCPRRLSLHPNWVSLSVIVTADNNSINSANQSESMGQLLSKRMERIPALEASRSAFSQHWRELTHSYQQHLGFFLIPRKTKFHNCSQPQTEPLSNLRPPNEGTPTPHSNFSSFLDTGKDHDIQGCSQQAILQISLSSSLTVWVPFLNELKWMHSRFLVQLWMQPICFVNPNNYKRMYLHNLFKVWLNQRHFLTVSEERWIRNTQ